MYESVRQLSLSLRKELTDYKVVRCTDGRIIVGVSPDTKVPDNLIPDKYDGYQVVVTALENVRGVGPHR